MKIGIVEYVDCAHSARINGQDYPLHGHTYKIEVTLDGEVKDDLVFDFCEMRDITREVLKKYNKKNLNEILDNSTGESFVTALHKDLKEKFPSRFKIGIKLWQGHNKWVEITE